MGRSLAMGVGVYCKGVGGDQVGGKDRAVTLEAGHDTVAGDAKEGRNRRWIGQTEEAKEGS